MKAVFTNFFLVISFFSILLPLTVFAQDTEEENIWVTLAIGRGSANKETGFSTKLSANYKIGSDVYTLRTNSFTTRDVFDIITLFGSSEEERAKDFTVSGYSLMYGRLFYENRLLISAGLGKAEGEYIDSGVEIYSDTVIPIELTYSGFKMFGWNTEISYSIDLHEDYTTNSLYFGYRFGFE